MIITENYLRQKEALYYLGIKNQIMIHECINKGLFREPEELRKIDQEISWLIKANKQKIDFAQQISYGKTLFV